MKQIILQYKSWLFLQFKFGIFIAICLQLTACGSSTSTNRAPVVKLSSASKKIKDTANAKAVYLVRNGETLFSIAKRNGMDAQRLAVLNGIQPPYRIATGQKLVFSEKTPRTNLNNAAPPIVSKTFVGNTKKIKATHFADSSAQTRQSSTKLTANSKPPMVKKGPAPTEGDKIIVSNIRWRWPVQGRIVRPFHATGKGKGIDIGGISGKPIKAAADGVVVYSGNGLKGYGNLIIIKHNEDFLSAYAHNRELKVKEGEQVRLGQEIALMGQTDSEQVKVHFEIRYKGKPVNPLKFLPKA